MENILLAIVTGYDNTGFNSKSKLNSIHLHNSDIDKDLSKIVTKQQVFEFASRMFDIITDIKYSPTFDKYHQ